MAFLSSFLTYLITAVILAVISFFGFKAGVYLRKRKNENEENSGSDGVKTE